ncbi:hypothetical protein Tsubulata_048253, partial [Turnera subulata]
VETYLGDYLFHKSKTKRDFPATFSKSSSGSLSTNDGLFVQPEPLASSNAVIGKILSRRSMQLLDQQKAWQESPEGKKMLEFRRSLPAYRQKDAILSAISQDQVVIISGETGCGKTTQIPQFILESEIESCRGALCSVICTQPRRISAISVSERVASERGESLGESVGYKVRLEGVRGKDTHLLFCTTGILLRRLLVDRNLRGITHVIVDEIHERRMNEEMTGYKLTPYNQIDDYGQEKAWRMNKQAPRKRKSQIASAVEDSLSCWNPDCLGFKLIENLLCHICENERRGAVLVFMTGWDDISALKDKLQAHPILGDPSRVLLLTCHGSMASSEQRLIFDKAEEGVRKIVLATNIAETSITINDVVFVLDCGKAKETSYDALNNTPCLLPSWISKVSAQQEECIDCIGKDKFGEEMKKNCTQAGVNVQYYEDEATPTGTCAVCVVGGESWPVQGCDEAQSTKGPVFWNGICTSAKPHPVGEDWWHDDVSFLRLPLYKRLILAVGSHGMKPEGIAGAIIHYSKRHLSLLGRDLSTQWRNYAAPGSTISATNEAEQRNLLEEIVELVPEQKGVTPSKFLLRLLRTAILINSSPSCRETLEKRIGAQLDQAALEDLLIPSTGYSVETLYDIDCVQRILDHFMLVDSDHFASNYIEEEQLMESSHSLTPVTMVANLMDSYLAEVAPDVNLKPKQFQSLAAAIPDYARPVDDGIYRAIDIYLKAHPWLTESEREQLCRLMSCQKFSLEASTHAAQNERLPLRVIIQVLFFEQLRLRTSISSWFFVSDNLENSQNASGNLALTRNDEPAQEVSAEDRIVAVDAMKKRVCELEKECSNMKQEIDKLVKTKGGWNTWLKKLGFSRQKPKAEDSKVLNHTKSKNSQGSSAAALLNGGQHQNGLSGD